jgi:hypothetical protein
MLARRLWALFAYLYGFNDAEVCRLLLGDGLILPLR